MACQNQRYQKSVVRYYNNTQQTMTEAQTSLVLKGVEVVNSGGSIRAGTAAYNLLTGGIYHVSADVTFTAADAGEALLQIEAGAVGLPCATAAISTATDGVYTVHVETDVGVSCCPVVGGRVITISIGGVDGTVTHVCSGVTRLA